MAQDERNLLAGNGFATLATGRTRLDLPSGPLLYSAASLFTPRFLPLARTPNRS